jgi:DNA-binding protein HU-beta
MDRSKKKWQLFQSLPIKRYFCNPKTVKYLYNLNKRKSDMTKAEIIAEISSKTGIEKVDVQETVEAFFKVVKSSMVGGENVYVRGFGSFVVKKRAKKTARNISKNTAIIIPEHFVPSFKPAKTFVEKVRTGNKASKASK